MYYDTYSGKILPNIFYHFPQFLVINEVNINYKRCSYSKRDFSNLNENNLVSDFYRTDNSFLNDPNINLNYKFEKFYDSLSSCVTICANKDDDKRRPQVSHKIMDNF